MARRKTRRRKSGTRRRKVSGITVKKNDKAMLAAGVAAGLVATAIGNDQLKKLSTPLNPWVIAIGEGVIGWFGPDMLAKGNAFVQGVGLGMIGAAGVSALQEANVISGIENVVNGWTSQNVARIPQSVVNGIPDIVQQAAAGKKTGAKKEKKQSAGSLYVNEMAMSGFSYDEDWQ